MPGHTFTTGNLELLLQHLDLLQRRQREVAFRFDLWHKRMIGGTPSRLDTCSNRMEKVAMPMVFSATTVDCWVHALCGCHGSHSHTDDSQAHTHSNTNSGIAPDTVHSPMSAWTMNVRGMLLLFVRVIVWYSDTPADWVEEISSIPQQIEK